jgi:hypothetical protein
MISRTGEATMTTRYIQSIKTSMARRPGLMSASARKTALRILLVFLLAGASAAAMIAAGFWIPGSAWPS